MDTHTYNANLNPPTHRVFNPWPPTSVEAHQRTVMQIYIYPKALLWS